ncbi:hypothetical protein [Streptomyces sp. NPDC046332]|uniref:hypothetical protein n=1 Tax=Streptomyces sp. NPDC046332 TaxID=3155133 RepID=UPI0033E077A1
MRTPVAWGNLFTSLYENGTRHLPALEALVKLFGEDRCSEGGVIQKVHATTIDDTVRESAHARSRAAPLGRVRVVRCRYRGLGRGGQPHCPDDQPGVRPHVRRR